MDVEANKNEVVNASADRAPATSVDTLRLEGATVLAVWAHPDDESYLGGRLMAAAAAAGGRVVNVTATLGEHGTPDPVTMPPGRLARIRQHELDHALQALGVSESITLGYEDGTLDTIDPDLGARRIMTVLDEIDPDVVVSFGPDGFTGHPDHIAVGAWTERAVNARNPQPALIQPALIQTALIQTAVGRWIPLELVTAMDELGAFFPGFAPEPRRTSDVRLALDDSAIDTKLAALSAHGSQTELFRAHLGDADYRRLAAVEAYFPANARAFDLLGASMAATAA
ncbi:MAG: LmbE family N-acetylglucosaminyl deacetylase [Ilumatobacter sp.]|jgi:LmbE family N-acetylglucosaminyl deacetylase